MTPEKLSRVLKSYQYLGSTLVQRLPGEWYSKSDFWAASATAIRVLVMRHINWMCQEAQSFLQSNVCGCGQNHGPDPSKVEKAMRWLGFIQGVLWCTGFKSLDDLRNDSKPDEFPFRTIMESEMETQAKAAADKIQVLVARGFIGTDTNRFDSSKENKSNGPNRKEFK
jgi:hypothetical protein